MTMHHRNENSTRRIRVRLLGASAVVAFLAAGCTTSSPETADASDLTIPGVVWENHPPSGAAEETQWAKDYRAQRLAEAAAYAYGDYSDPDLIAIIGYDRAVELAEWNQEHSPPHTFIDADGTYRDDAPVRTRPQWEAVIEVVEHGDGSSATVVTCQSSWFGKNSESTHPCQRVVLTRNADGILSSQVPPGMSDSDFADITPPPFDEFPRGYWVEPIDAPTLPDRIKMPLERAYYVEVGAIDR